MAGEELVGPLPDGWEYTTLGFACQRGGGDIQTGPFGSQLHAADYVPIGIPSIMPQNIGDNRIVEEGIARITADDAKRLSRYLVRSGDIVYSRRGDVERRALVQDHEDGWLCGTGCLRVRLGKRGSDPRFATYYLGHPAVREWIVRHAHGATMPNLNTGILGACPFVVPPPEEERAIAHILGTLDDKIELNRQMNETLEAMARALFKSWFVNFDPVRAKAEGRDTGLPKHIADLFPDSFEDSELGEIPKGWDLRTIEDLSEQVAMGPFGSSIKVSTFVSEGVPVISGQHLRNTLLDDSEFNFITEEHADQLKRSNVQRGDVIFTHAGSIGQASYVPETSRYVRYIISQRQFYMRCNPKKISPLFIVSYFKTPGGQHRLLANTSSTGVPSISQPVSYLRHLKIPTPPHRLLRIFDSAVRAIYFAAAHNKNQSRTLANLRDSLLPKLISGELRLKKAERFVKGGDMKLLRVKIHNFRSLLEQEISLKGYSLLVGPNNAGKSSVIDAIRAFYEKDGFKFKKENDFPFTGNTDQESWIELVFLLTDEENDSLAEDYKVPAKLLRVRKYFQATGKTHDGKPTVGSIFGYKSDGTLSNEPFYGAKNVQSGKFGDLVYIPAISKVDEHAKLSGPSALRDLLTDIMTDVVEAGKAYGDFSVSVQKFSDSIRDEKTGDDRSLSGFEDELNALLKPWDSEFRLKFPPPSAAEIIKSMLGWDLFDQFHGKAQGIDYYGSGFQRHFIYSLIQLGSKYVGKKATKKTKDFTPSLSLVLFEEPEAFLHPPQQEILARSLMAVASSGHWQVVCATHSSHFVSKNAADIPAVVRLRRTTGTCEAFQINEAVWAEVVDANQAITAIANKYPKMARKLHEDDARPEMEAVKHFLWLNPDRSSVFFANHVLLVEGATEVAFVNRLVGDGKIANADCGLYVLDCIGKYNIHRFMNFLSRLGVSHAVIHDDDNSKDEHAEINKLIEESKHATLTLCVKQIVGNLEVMLGISPAGSDHRKPQHILYQYDSGKVDPGKVQALCSLVEACLPAKNSNATAVPSVAGA